MIVIPMNRGQFCTGAGCEVQTRYAMEVVPGKYEYRCRSHCPPGTIQEYWTMRMLNTAQLGNFEEARELLKVVFAEVRVDAQEECAKIADIVEQDAHNTYSSEDMARGARIAAKEIAHSIRFN